MRIILAIVLLVLVSGCVTPISLEEQVPTASYTPEAVIGIRVIDDRERVNDGKDPTFIGRAHGAFGIPVDWHVKTALNTHDGDADRTLAEFLQHRLVSGLQARGWNAASVENSALTGEEPTTDELLETGADLLMTVELNEWFFSINLNWVTAFNFDSDVDVTVLNAHAETVLNKNIKDRDVIDEKADESPQNLILRAYRDQLIQILDDPEVRAALERGMP